MDNCFVHPEEPADGKCLQCGKPLCEKCLKESGEFGLIMCPDCMIQIVVRPHSAGF